MHSFALISLRRKPFDLSQNFTDLGRRFPAGEQITQNATDETTPDRVVDGKRDLDWPAVLKRAFESYIRDRILLQW